MSCDSHTGASSSKSELKTVSYQETVKRLGEVTHCAQLDEDAIFKKATRTIRILKKQSFRILSSFPRLKRRNDELVFFMQQEQGGAAPCDSLPTDPSLSNVTAYSVPSHIEEYNEDYDIPGVIQPSTWRASPCCVKLFCRLGCVCDSLKAGYFRRNHCSHNNCIFQNDCNSLGNKPCVLFDRLKSDPKLKQKCVVRLNKRLGLCLAREEKNRLQDAKLDPKLAKQSFVRLVRLSSNPNRKVYCMVHHRYKCRCLYSTKSTKNDA